MPPKIHIDLVPNCDRKTMAREKSLGYETFLDLVGARVEVKQKVNKSSSWVWGGNRASKIRDTEKRQ